MDDIDGFILAGGASSRMGRRKSEMMLGGKSFVERARESLSEVAQNIRAVGKREVGDRDQTIEWIEDLTADEPSSMLGLITALTHCEKSWAIVLACDLPFVSSALLSRLRSFRNSSVDAVVLVQPDGRLQPLCALFRREPCLQQATKLIKEGNRSLHALVKRLNSRYVEFDEIKDIEGSDLFFFNINTPDDFERAKAILAESL